MATTTKGITTGGDDGWIKTNALMTPITTGPLRMRNYTHTNTTLKDNTVGYMLFKGITIPQFSIISVATFKANCALGNTNPTPGFDNFGVKFNTTANPSTLTGPPSTASKLPFGSSGNFPTDFVTGITHLGGTSLSVYSSTSLYPQKQTTVTALVQALVNANAYTADNMMMYSFTQSATTVALIGNQSGTLEITYLNLVDKTTYVFV